MWRNICLFLSLNSMEKHVNLAHQLFLQPDARTTMCNRAFLEIESILFQTFEYRSPHFASFNEPFFFKWKSKWPWRKEIVINAFRHTILLAFFPTFFIGSRWLLCSTCLWCLYSIYTHTRLLSHTQRQHITFNQTQRKQQNPIALFNKRS